MENQTPLQETPPIPAAPPKRGMSKVMIGILIGLGLLPFLSVVFAIVLIAMNPAKQFKQANDVKRRNDTLQILNAVWQYADAHQGAMPPAITGTPQEISSTGAAICSDLVPTYIAYIPVDPSLNTGDITDCSNSYATGYLISVDPTTNRVYVSAPKAELETDISVTR
jgi:hypothetical protein